MTSGLFETCDWNRIGTYVLPLIRNINFINNLLLLGHLYVAIMFFEDKPYFGSNFGRHLNYLKHVNETKLAHMY
jgi:hypothetical protein